MKRIEWTSGLAGFGIGMTLLGVYDVLIDRIHLAAIDAGLVAIVALILLAMAASR